MKPGAALRRPARGVVLRPNRAPSRAAHGAAAIPARRGETLRVVVLALTLPFFAQSFQYLIDAPPLYLLCKAWPLLVLPLAGWALLRLDLPDRALQLVTWAWVFAVTPFIGVIVLGNSIVDALTTTAKVWALTVSFSGAAALVLLRPEPRTLRRVLLGLGVFTYVITLVIYAVAPAWLYLRDNSQTKLFIWDEDRGFHLYMPMYFGLLFVFVLNRQFWIDRRWWQPVAIVVCFVIMALFIKERLQMAGGALVIVLAAARSMRPGRPRLAAYAGVFAMGCVGAVAIASRLQSSAVKESLGGSLSNRQETVMQTLQYLGADAARWVFGVGATSRVGSVTLIGLFKNTGFYLADIGWLGVVFEYGAIGSILLMLVHLAGLRQAMSWARPDDALSLALGDYIIYILVSSAVYSVVFLPGELTTCMALAYYLNRTRPGRGPRMPGPPFPSARRAANPGRWLRTSFRT